MKRYTIRLLGKKSFLLTIILSATNIVYSMPQPYGSVPKYDWDRLEGVYVSMDCWVHHAINYNPRNFLIEPTNLQIIGDGLTPKEMLYKGTYGNPTLKDNATVEFAKFFNNDLVRYDYNELTDTDIDWTLHPDGREKSYIEMVEYVSNQYTNHIPNKTLKYIPMTPSGFKYSNHECQVYIIDFSKNVFYTIIDNDLSDIWLDRENDYYHDLINKKFKIKRKEIRFNDFQSFRRHTDMFGDPKKARIQWMQHLQVPTGPSPLKLMEHGLTTEYNELSSYGINIRKSSRNKKDYHLRGKTGISHRDEHIDFIKSRGTYGIFTHNYFKKFPYLWEYPLSSMFVRISSHIPPRWKGDGTVSSYDILSKIKIQSNDSFNYGLVDTSHVFAMDGTLQSSIPLFSGEVYKKDSTTDLKLTKLFDKNSAGNLLNKVIGLEFNLHDYIKNNKDKIIQDVLPSVSNIKYTISSGHYYILPQKYSKVFTNNLLEYHEFDKPTKTVRGLRIVDQVYNPKMVSEEVLSDFTIRGNKTLDKLVNGFYSGVGGNMSSADRRGLRGKLIGPLKQVGVDEERFGGRKQYRQWFTPENAIGTREWYTKDEVIKYFGSELKAIENDIVPEDSVFFRQNHWVKNITLLYGKKGIIETINVDNLKNRNEEGFPNRKETKTTQLEITWDVRWSEHNGVFDKKNPRYGQTNNWFVINIKSLNKKIYFLATSMGSGGRYYGWDALKGNSSSDLGMRIPEKNISLFDKLRKSYNASVEKTPIAERKVTYLSNLIDKEIADGDKKRSFQILLRINQPGNSSYTMKTIALPNLNNYPKLGVPEYRVLYSPFTPYSDDTEYIIDLDRHIIETDLMIDIYGMVIAR